MQFFQQLRLYPFIRIFIPFVLGIVTGFKLHISSVTLLSVIAVLLIILLFIHLFLKSFKIRWIFGLGTNLTLFLAGIVILNTHIPDATRYNSLINRYSDFKAEVLKDPAEKENSIRILLRSINFHRNFKDNQQVKILAYFQKDTFVSSLNVGDILLVHSRLKEIEGPKNPYEFNYKKRMQLKGVYLTTYVDSASWIRIGKRTSVISFAASIRKKIFEIYKACGIEGDEFAVLTALTLGYRDQISDELTQYYAASGAIHILAVSGLHVGIIFLLMNHLLFFMKQKWLLKILRMVIIILSLWTFALIAGLSPSVTRAAFMFSVIQVGKSIKRSPEIYNVLAFSAFTLLMIDPFLIADVGFQFSYLAVAGIIYFQPRIYNLIFTQNKMLDRIWQLVSVSLAAQLSTAPLAIYYFHYFPAYFWITNTLIIPMVGIIIYMAFFLILAYVSHLPYIFIGRVLFYFLKIQNFLIFNIQNLPHAMIQHLDISVIQVALFYILLICGTIFAIKRIRFYLYTSLSIIIALLAIHTFSFVRHEKQKKLIVFDIKNQQAVSLINGKTAFFITDFDDADMIPGIFQIENYLIKNDIRQILNTNLNDADTLFENSLVFYRKTGNNIFFGTDGFRVAIIGEPNFIQNNSKGKIKLDCIILTNIRKTNLTQLTSAFRFNYLIFSDAKKINNRNTWLNDVTNPDYKIHSLIDNHAFELDFD